jgi:hypothetical protein
MTTRNQVERSGQGKAQIDHVTATYMGPRPAQVGHQLARRSGFFQGVRLAAPRPLSVAETTTDRFRPRPTTHFDAATA